MKKKFNIRNLIIIMLCITIIFMAIGFSYLCIKLEHITNTPPVFDVSITKVEKETAVKGGLIEPKSAKEIINKGKTVKFNFELNSPKDELAYTITIKNTGTIPANIIKIISTPDYINDPTSASSIEPVEITLDEIENKVLAPSKEIKVKLVVSYNMSNKSNQKIIPYQLTVLANSAQ